MAGFQVESPVCLAFFSICSSFVRLHATQICQKEAKKCPWIPRQYCIRAQAGRQQFSRKYYGQVFLIMTQKSVISRNVVSLARGYQKYYDIPLKKWGMCHQPGVIGQKCTPSFFFPDRWYNSLGESFASPKNLKETNQSNQGIFSCYLLDIIMTLIPKA